MEVLCRFRLVLEGKTSKHWRLEFLEKFLANNFALSDAEDNAYIPLNRGGIADLPLRRTLLAIRQKPRDSSDGLSYFSSICKFGSFKNHFTTITSLSELYFRFSRFILLVQTKKYFLWTIAAAKDTQNQRDEWGLTWYLRWGIYTLIPTWTHSQNSLATVEALSLKISSYGTSFKWSRRPC